jgi:hypothetical protein
VPPSTPYAAHPGPPLPTQSQVQEGRLGTDTLLTEEIGSQSSRRARQRRRWGPGVCPPSLPTLRRAVLLVKGSKEAQLLEKLVVLGNLMRGECMARQLS